MAVIYQYSNRKYYDSRTSLYTNLGEMWEMIRRGDKLVVIDYKSKRDITDSVFKTMLFYREKENETRDVKLLHRIIRSGRTITKYIKELEK